MKESNEFLEKNLNSVVCIDVLEGLKNLPDNSINTIITSPPYNKTGLDKSLKKKGGNQCWGNYQINYDVYGDDMEEDKYKEWQIKILNECFRVLRKDGSMFYNHKIRRLKNSCHFPLEFIFKSDFNIYQEIIWNRNCTPNISKFLLFPITERIYWLTKENKKIKIFKNEIPKEFRKEVWNIGAAKPNKNHPAPFNPLIPELCIKLTTEPGDIVLDIFSGIGTTFNEAKKLNRNFIGFELSEEYIKLN